MTFYPTPTWVELQGFADAQLLYGRNSSPAKLDKGTRGSLDKSPLAITGDELRH